MDSGRRALVGACWRYHQMSGGDRAQRLAADEHWWAVGAVHDAVRARPVGEVVEMLDQLLGAPEADAVSIGAGPLETLLHERPEAADAVARLCQSSPPTSRWRAAIAAVWLTGHRHDRLPALARFLPPPIDRP